MTITIYTDGACSGNPGPGGWAWAIPNGAFESGAEPKTTNQRMELMAVLQALRKNDGPVEIVSDSTYVVHCFRDKWHVGWLKRGWVNSKNQPVANRDIWEPLIQLVLARKNVTFRWVKGHNGDPMNDWVDRLAVEATQAGRGTSGSRAQASSDTTRAMPAQPLTSGQPLTPTQPLTSGQPRWVVVFRAQLASPPTELYSTTAARMRSLAFEQFGCLGFDARCEGGHEIAVSYWPDEAHITAWKRHAEHVFAQEQGRAHWYSSYQVEVASIARSYCWPDRT